MVDNGSVAGSAGGKQREGGKEEQKLAIRADWDADKGIWATYIPYPGAQPLIVNYLRDDADVDPGDYSDCMKSKGYTIRSYEIPEITNIRLHGRSN